MNLFSKYCLTQGTTKSLATLLLTIFLLSSVSFSQNNVLIIDFNTGYTSDQASNGSRIYTRLIASQASVDRVNTMPLVIDTALYTQVWVLGDMGLPVAANLAPIVNYMNVGGAVYVQSEIMCCDNQAAYIDSLINVTCIAGGSIDHINNTFGFFEFEPVPNPQCSAWVGHGNAARVFDGVPPANVFFAATGNCGGNFFAGEVIGVRFGPSDMITGQGALICVGDFNIFPTAASCTVTGLVNTQNDKVLIDFIANSFITVQNAPGPVEAGNDVTICSGDSTTLTASGAGGTYQWNTGDTTASITVSPSVNTTYFVTADTVCPTTDSVVVSVTDLTVDAGPNDTICNGDTTVLTASGGGAYQWSTGDTTASITVSPLVDTTYYVTVTDGICSPITDSVNISVLDYVIASVSPLVYVACVADTLTFTNSSNGINYYWNFGNGDTSTAVSPTYNYTTGGTYNGSLIATDLTSCNINDTVLFVVTITELTVDAGLNDTICAGDLTVLTASGGGNYLWSTGDTTASITVSPSVDTAYYVTATDSFCSSTDTVQVSVGQPPSAVAISGPNQLCMDSAITLTVQGPGPYTWSTGDTLNSITVSPTASASYWVQSTNTCGMSSDTVSIMVTSPPVLQLSGDTTIIIGETVTLAVSGAALYLWSTGSNSTSIAVSPDQTATYTVAGTDSFGCVAEASVMVTVTIPVESLPFVYLPNVFSTASDNPDNEKLHVFGQGIKNLELTIYDRWGEQVYSTADVSENMRNDGECCAYGDGWDGTYNNTGRLLNGSVFVFTLKGEFEDGGEFNESGNITLIQ